MICSGMRKDNAKHGVVRVVRPGKYIIEGTFKHGLAHGLQICYDPDVVTYSRYEDGALMSDDIKVENQAQPAVDEVEEIRSELGVGSDGQLEVDVSDAVDSYGLRRKLYGCQEFGFGDGEKYE